MNSELDGKVVAITGGSEGIGKAIAHCMADLGAKIVIGARRLDVLEQTAAELRDAGAEVEIIAIDAVNVDDMRRFVEGAVQRFGRIDILVNNAGGTGQSAFDAVDDDAWRRDLEIKVMAQVRSVRAAIPHMKKQGGGRIINMNMTGAKQPGFEKFPTTISRAAGLALTKALSKELAGFNILVNAIALGKIKSKSQERRAARDGISIDEHYAKTGAAIPLGRMGEASEVAAVVAFLASDAASYVTGTCINVDGGLSDVI